MKRAFRSARGQSQSQAMNFRRPLLPAGRQSGCISDGKDGVGAGQFRRYCTIYFLDRAIKISEGFLRIRSRGMKKANTLQLLRNVLHGCRKICEQF